jgi:cytochrome c-type biogenesis protein
MSAAALVAVTLCLCSLSGVAQHAAPEYEAAYLHDGGTLAIGALRGEVLLLNTWATWCGPCKEEIPELERLHQEFGARGLNVIGVSIDRTQTDDAIQAFATGHGATFPLASDPENDFARAFDTTGVPETVLIDRSGAIAFRWKGALEPGSVENRRIIDQALTSDGAIDTAAIPRSITIGLAAAFGAGLLSILSPCVLPLLPTYAAVIAGIGADDLARRQARMGGRRIRWLTLRNGLLFVAGFSIVFILLGASASAIGEMLRDYRIWLARTGGFLLLVFGLHMLGIFRIGALDRIARLDAGRAGAFGPFGIFAVGAAFGAGWTPCIGPVLASILTLAAATASPGQGMALLTVYSAGLAIPFLAATVMLDRFMERRSAFGAWTPWVERISAVLILSIGVLMVTGFFERLSIWASQFGGFG